VQPHRSASSPRSGRRRRRRPSRDAASCLPQLLQAMVKMTTPWGAGCGLSLTAPTSNYRRYNPYTDLLVCGTPCSKIWKQAWYIRPLLLDDKYLVWAKKSAYTTADILAVRFAEAFLDANQQMTAILNSHPVPIATFRVDTSKWIDDSVLRTCLRYCPTSLHQKSHFELGTRYQQLFPHRRNTKSKS